jgi:hypothetical protein
VAENQVDKAFQHAAHLAEIQRRASAESGSYWRISASRRSVQRLFDGQIKRHLHLFIPRKLIERDPAPGSGVQHAVQPCGQHRRHCASNRSAAAFRHPVGGHRLGKIQIFKQAVQERPRRRAARELVRRQLRLFHDFTDAGGIDIQTRQQILRRALTMLLQSGVAGHPPVIGTDAQLAG